MAAKQTDSGTGIGAASKERQDQEKLERDYEMFLDNVKEDEGCDRL
jgi:hypothetical protein